MTFGFGTRVRRLALAGALLPVLAAGISVTASVVGSAPARAASTGFHYAAGIFPTITNNLSLGDVTNIHLQDDPVAVEKTMTPGELQAATTALGGAPTEGFEVTKAFDNTDKSTSIAALAQTTLFSGGLYTYYNGALCQHLRGAPAYVAFVNQALPPAGSTAALTETIEIVSTTLVSESTPTTCPTSSGTTTGGTTYAGSVTANSTAYPFTDILSFKFGADAQEVSHLMSAGETATYTGQAGSQPYQFFTVKKGIDRSDSSFGLAAFTGKIIPNSSFQFEVLNSDGTPALSYTFTDPMMVSVDLSGEQSIQPVETIVLAVPKVTITYIG